MFFTHDRDFYRAILSIAIPLVAQNLLTFSISMVDSVMVGGLGEAALSATSLANKFFFIMMILVFGIAGGSNVLIAQFWGKKDVASIHQVMAIMYRVLIATSFLFFAAAQLIPEDIIRLYAGDNTEVVAAGAIYLRAVSWGYPLFNITNATVAVLRSVQTVKISSIIYAISLFISASLNWVLIYGNMGAPRLGIAGAALATCIARVAEFLILLLFLAHFEHKLKLSPAALLPVNPVMVRSFIANCLPVIANEGLWVAGSTLISMITGRLGTTVVAAAGIEGILWQLVTVMLFGVQNSAAVLIGNIIGAGQRAKLREYTKTLITLSFILGPIASGLMFLLKPLVLGFYQSFEPVTLEVATLLINISAFILIFQSISFIGMMGILRGGGDLRFVLVADVIFLWFVSLPLGYFAGLVWHLPIPLVFLCLRSDEILKTVLCLWRMRNDSWARDLTLSATPAP